MILLDTSVLLRLIQIGHPHQRPAVEAIALFMSVMANGW
jgi:predicted nucleic acid-binding protein